MKKYVGLFRKDPASIRRIPSRIMACSVLLCAFVFSACGGDGGGGSSQTGTVGSSTNLPSNGGQSYVHEDNPRAPSSSVPKPVLQGPIADDVGIKGRPFGISVVELAPIEPYDYVEEEYFFSGVAQERDADGVLTGGPEAAFTSRFLVRRPRLASASNGTVLLEWFNVTGQSDTDVLWNASHDMLMRQGFIYVGVSAQAVGISGGSPLALKNWDAVRYDPLIHPGDSYSWDIYAQAGRALFSQAAGESPLGDVIPKRMIAAGESQSSYRLVAYSDVIQREHLLFDGFFLHTGPVAGKGVDDVGVPVMYFITETEIDGIIVRETGGAVLDYTEPADPFAPLSSAPPYGADRGLIRVWEVAGGSHFDKQLWAYTTAFAAREASAPADVPIYIEQPALCALPLNELGQGRAATAALHHLNNWVSSGQIPVSRPRITLSDSFRIVRDADGLALGGIRMPSMVVPTGVNRGDECAYWGSFQPFLEPDLRERYPTRKIYIDAVTTAAMRNVAEGTLLAEEAQLYIDDAEALSAFWSEG